MAITKPESAVLELKTLTPLYTGGIGQNGEQLHPSGLLGSIRHWSCLVARALGDRGFETRVWGKVGATSPDTQAKGVAVRWDASGLKPCTLPSRIQVNGNRGWFFNEALTGQCRLTLTRRNISDADWRILLLALRIQIRHGMLGAKDQFGLGVVGCDKLPEVKPLVFDQDKFLKEAPKDEEDNKKILTDTLWHTRFFKITFKIPRNQAFNIEDCLKLGLGIRHSLRNALRVTATDYDTEGLKNLRHIMLGALNEHGSCTNISAAYGIENPIFPMVEIRVAIQLTPEPKHHKHIMNSFNYAINAFQYNDWEKNKPSYVWGNGIGSGENNKFKNIAEWINYLAGVSA